MAFLGFVMFFVGLIATFIGAVMISSVKREWKVFYLQQNEYTRDSEEKRKKALLKAKIVMGCGIFLFAISFFIG